MPDPGEFLRNDDGEGTDEDWLKIRAGHSVQTGNSYPLSRFGPNLGGCPENQAGGRFSTVSILTTASQEEFVRETCQLGV